MMTATVPPTALHAEQAVLGELLRRGPAFSSILGTLKADMFADPVHAETFARIVGYDERDRDPALLIDDLHGSTGDDPLVVTLSDPCVGGVGYLSSLLAAPATSLDEAAASIREAWVLRDLIRLGERLGRIAEDVVGHAFNGCVVDESPSKRILSDLRTQIDDVAAALSQLTVAGVTRPVAEATR